MKKNELLLRSFVLVISCCIAGVSGYGSTLASVQAEETSASAEPSSSPESDSDKDADIAEKVETPSSAEAEIVAEESATPEQQGQESAESAAQAEAKETGLDGEAEEGTNETSSPETGATEISEEENMAETNDLSAGNSVLINQEITQTDESIPIDEEHFPDSHFRKELSSKWHDKNVDGILSTQERNDVTYLSFGGDSIRSLKGIEYFPNLQSLDCSNNLVTSLDLSNNSELQFLNCSSNKLTSLDVSNNSGLHDLHCDTNQLSSLDLSNNTVLRSLSCSDNRIFTLDLKNNSFLRDCDVNFQRIFTPYSIDSKGNYVINLTELFPEADFSRLYFRGNSDRESWDQENGTFTFESLTEGSFVSINGEFRKYFEFSYILDFDSGREITGDFILGDEDNEHISMFRLYNPNSGEHFYTGSAQECENLKGAGWKLEGFGWIAPASSGTPVYRLYNPNAGDHHYTMSAEEKDNLIKIGWKYEGIAWNSDTDKQVPLYRLYNPNAKSGAHHYTMSIEERDQLAKIGWNYEGIAWYGLN